MEQYQNIAGKDRYTFQDMDGNEIVTTDPQKVLTDMWVKFYPIPCSMNVILRDLDYGDSILMEDSRILIRKHYRIV